MKVRSSILSLKHLAIVTRIWRRGKNLDEKVQRKNATNSCVLVASFPSQLLSAKWILPSRLSDFVSAQPEALYYLLTTSLLFTRTYRVRHGSFSERETAAEVCSSWLSCFVHSVDKLNLNVPTTTINFCVKCMCKSNSLKYVTFTLS